MGNCTQLISNPYRRSDSNAGRFGFGNFECDASGWMYLDRTISWDIRRRELEKRHGEKLLHTWEDVEDNKGNGGLGRLELTNMRLIWIANASVSTNMCIGLGLISGVNLNMTTSSVYGRGRAVVIMTLSHQTRFEFAFSVGPSFVDQIFNCVDSALRRYCASAAFRDVSIGDRSIFKQDSLNLLYGECIERTVGDCNNVTGTGSSPGVLHITNYRVVWKSECPSIMNISIPYLHMATARSRVTPLGPVLHLLLNMPGSTVEQRRRLMGFGMQSIDILSNVVSDVNRLLTASRANPCLVPEGGRLRWVDDEMVIIDDSEEESNVQGPSMPYSPVSEDEDKEGKSTSASSSPSTTDGGPSTQSAPRLPKCVLCMTDDAKGAFDPCGHICSCIECAKKLTSCPICRSRFERFLRVYVAEAV